MAAVCDADNSRRVLRCLRARKFSIISTHGWSQCTKGIKHCSITTARARDNRSQGKAPHGAVNHMSKPVTN